MIDNCPVCNHQQIEYQWSQPSSAGDPAWDVYRCGACGALIEVMPEYLILENKDAIAVEDRSECPEGMAW